jgi:hypothetical protein
MRALTVGLLFACMAVSAMATAESNTARGVVFHDRNGDGDRDRDEPGVADVAVSNGRDVVVTDEDGRWSLPVGENTTLFITKPSGWAVPVDANNLPQFYRHHVPAGSSEHLRFPGIAPTGPLPDSIDFPLVPSDEPETFSVLCFSDPQPQTSAEVGYIRDAIAPLIGTDAAFGVTTGDIMFDDLSLLDRSNRIVAQLGIPWYNVPGNHEMNFLASGDAESLETFRRVFGPAYYSFDVGSAHFVVLDTTEYFGSNQGRDEPDPVGAGGYRGAIDADQLTWLEADLALVPKDRLVVFAMHIPLGSIRAPDHPGVTVGNRRALFGLLEGRHHVFAIAGHTHTVEHIHFDESEGWDGDHPLHMHTLATVSGAWWSGPLDGAGMPISYQRDGTPRGYYLLEVDGSDVTVRFRAFGRPADHQMRIQLDSAFPRPDPGVHRDFRHGELHDTRIALSQVPSTELVVNLFDGGPRSVVTAQVGDRPLQTLVRTLRLDPFVEELFMRTDPAVMKSWVKPVPSTHIWTGPLPSDLTVGTSTIHVHATDEYGEHHHATAILEIYQD